MNPFYVALAVVRPYHTERALKNEKNNSQLSVLGKENMRCPCARQGEQKGSARCSLITWYVVLGATGTSTRSGW